jgi:hypothetical protein
MVAKCVIPADSQVKALQAQADFWDGFEVPLADPAHSAMYAYLDATGSTPRWIDRLMAIRNAAVRPLRLKNVGLLAAVPAPEQAGTLRPGQRVGIFTLRSVSEREVVLDIRDRHLDVVVAAYRTDGNAPVIKMLTLVFYHNWLGRLYMLPVAPMHKLVVRSIMARYARR